MKAFWQRQRTRLRAASAVLLLLLGWFSAPVSWATSLSDVCSMSCCVTSGHCCCTPRHPLVEGQDPNGQDTLERGEITSSCPAECATSAFSSGVLMREQDRAAAYSLDFSDARTLQLPRRTRIHDLYYSAPSSPRAPPILSLA